MSNGENIPPGLPELRAGRYVVEPVQEEAPVLTPEEAGIEVLLNWYRQGRVVDAKRVREISPNRQRHVTVASQSTAWTRTSLRSPSGTTLTST